MRKQQKAAWSEDECGKEHIVASVLSKTLLGRVLDTAMKMLPEMPALPLAVPGHQSRSALESSFLLMHDAVWVATGDGSGSWNPVTHVGDPG